MNFDYSPAALQIMDHMVALAQRREQELSQFSELLRYSRPMMTAAGVITLMIMIVGVIGNLLTVLALLRNAKIRTVAAAFIASLCISDLMFCFLVLPFAASQFLHGKWIHGPMLCVMIPVLRYGSVGVSLLSVATISINRYILIAWPQHYARIYTKTKVILYISAIWIFSYGIQVPTMLGKWGTYGLDHKLGTCSIRRDERGGSPKSFLFIFGFALPCIVIVVCYTKIFWVVRQSHKRLMEQRSAPLNAAANSKRGEMKITKMVLVIFVCFIVCYLPITLVKIYDENVRHAPLHIIGYLLIYMSSCVNPVVYVTMNRQYRQAYLDTLKCRYGVSSHHPDSTPRINNSMNHAKTNPNIISVNYCKSAPNV